jgi:hypothetical protein
MMVKRMVGSVAAGIASFLLMLSAHAAPAAPDQAGAKLRLVPPTLVAQASDPYAPPQAPPPGYPATPYPPPYAAPYYYPQPIDMRPQTMEYDPNRPIPAGYRVVSYARKGFVVSGSIIFGISYGMSILIAGESSEASSSDHIDTGEVPFSSGMLYIPVLGPWIALGTLKSYNCSYSSSYSCTDAKSESDAWRTLLIFDGVAQVWGAAFVVLGLSWRWQQLVLTENVRAQIVPVQMGPTGRGLAMVGSFSGL